MSESILLVSVIAAGTLALLFVSRRCLLQPRAHGFYRFFAFEAVFLLLVINVRFWFHEPLTVLHVFSWILLTASAVLAIQGFLTLKHAGRPSSQPVQGPEFRFEQTSKLVTSGVYRFIRHPLYASLLYLAWGIFFKDVSLTSSILVVIASIFLIATAKVEEGENLRHFGDQYQGYVRRTKMFIPYVY